LAFLAFLAFNGRAWDESIVYINRREQSRDTRFDRAVSSSRPRERER